MAALSISLLLILSLVSTVSGYLQIYPPVDENDTRTPLHFALLQSFGSEYNGSGSVAGLQVALDRINSDPTLLPGYRLHYTLTDSQVMHNVGIPGIINCHYSYLPYVYVYVGYGVADPQKVYICAVSI